MKKFFIVLKKISKGNVMQAWGGCCCDGICLLSLSTLCSLLSPQPSITCVGDGMLFPTSVSSGESRGCKPKGHSWFTGCSGDRLQLLSSSHDELPSDVFWNCKSWRGEFGRRRRKRDWQMKTCTHLPTRESVFPPDAGKLLHLPPLLSVCVCVFVRVSACCQYTSLQTTAKLLSPAFTGAEPCWFLLTVQTQWTVPVNSHPEVSQSFLLHVLQLRQLADGCEGCCSQTLILFNSACILCLLRPFSEHHLVY